MGMLIGIKGNITHVLYSICRWKCVYKGTVPVKLNKKLWLNNGYFRNTVVRLNTLCIKKYYGKASFEL